MTTGTKTLLLSQIDIALQDAGATKAERASTMEKCVRASEESIHEALARVAGLGSTMGSFSAEGLLYSLVGTQILSIGYQLDELRG